MSESKRGILASLDYLDSAVEAIEALRKAGFKRKSIQAYSPIPVHDLEHAMGYGQCSVRVFALVGLLMMSAGCTPLDDVMAGIFGRSMRDQPSFDPYEAPLAAPEGSIPFASGNFPARIGEVNLGQPDGLEDVPPPFTQRDLINEANVVVNLPNPVPATVASLDRGEDLFLRFCAPCHGPSGDGVSGYIIPAGYPPYPLVSDKVRGFTDGFIYGMIRMGRGNMPPYGHRITHFDRWNVVNHLRVLQGAASAPLLDEGRGNAPSH